MNKIKRLCAFVFMLLGVISLASCSKTFDAGIDELLATRDTITVKASFNEDDSIKSGKAVPYVKIYTVNDKNEEKYIDDDQNINLNVRKDAGTAEFDNLDPGQKYKVYLYIKFDGTEYKVGEPKTATTLNNGTSADDPVKISNVDEFLAMGKDNDGFYELSVDLDFKGAQIDDMFTSSNPFKGHFEGNSKKLSNFKIKSASNAGIFGQADGATIQNLTIENPIIPWENGRSSTNAAVLVGRAINTTIKNINIINAKINVSANSSADINLGVLVGLSENSSVSNVKIVNADMILTRSRLNMSAGLAFGMLKGTAGDNVFVENVYVEGKINANCYYNNSEGFTYIGGFAGNIGALGLVKNSAALVDITITKEVNTQYTDDFSLAVGGFIGMNAQGQMNITNCAAISDIKVYAGKAPAEGTSNESLNEVQMSKQPIYIGGFIGRAKALFMQIKDCNAIEKTDGAGIKIYAALKEVIKEEAKPEDKPNETTPEATTAEGEETKPEEPKEPKQLVYSGAFVGETDLANNIKNCDGKNLDLFDDVIKAMINDKALAI